jgi:catechol 2,3-dioxygenase-like lactoylglutathione lyase family enzyme
VTRFDLVTIDTPHPDVLARFWCAALALRELEREDIDRWVVIGDDVRRIGLQRGRHVPGGIHLDLACESHRFDEEVQRLLSLGARLLAPTRSEAYGSIANMADPDGNPFDLCAYT